MKKSLYSALLLTSVLLLGACGNSATTDTGKAMTDQQSKASEASTPEQKITNIVKEFPEKKATDIVTTSVTIAEMLNILHIEPIGLPTSSHPLPEGFEHITKVGTAVEPDIEKIVSLSPDLVIGANSVHTNLEKKMKNTSIPSAFISTDSYEDLKIGFEGIAKALGKEDLAAAYLKKLEAQEQEIIQAADVSKKKVMLIFGSGESFMLMNTNTYVGSLVEKLGAQNIITETTKSKEAYVPLNMEDVVATNPDTIFLISHGDADIALKQFKKEVKKNGAWDSLNALKNDHVAALDYNLFGYSSIVKIPEALKTLQQTLEK